VTGMELYQIRYFLTLCDTLSFARAAERCHVSSPSLTRAMQKLEQELGGTLIRRERRLSHLTELGQLVRPLLEQVLANAELAKTRATRFLDTERAPLKLGVMSTLGPNRLAPFLARFSMAGLGAELTIVEARLVELHELLCSGILDVAIATRLESAHVRLKYRPLYDERLVVVFPAGHRFAKLDAVPLCELRGENYLQRPHCGMEDALVRHCTGQGFKLRVVYRSERDDWIETMIAAGRGITIMPEYTHFGRATLARMLIDPELGRSVSVVTIAGPPHSALVTMLLRAAQAHRGLGEVVNGAAYASSDTSSRGSEPLVVPVVH
jgi:LysR family hydrogen peroxide-inducible transcriptional activator